MDMPLNLAFEQAKQKIAVCINHCLQELKIPTFMMNIILRDLNSEVLVLANKELEQATIAYSTIANGEQTVEDTNINENEEPIKSEN